MDIPSIWTPPAIYSIACYTSVLTGVICAVVRWFHQCRPYDQQSDYYYPARYWLTGFFAASIVKVPYVINPMDDDIWLFLQFYCFLSFPVFISIIFTRYFLFMKLKDKLRNMFFFFTPMTFLLVILMLALFKPGDLRISDHEVELKIFVMGTNMLLGLRLVNNFRWIKQKIDNFHDQNYSNVEDFPYKFAKFMMWFPAISITVLWFFFLTNSRWFMVLHDVIFSAGCVYALCLVLHPQRKYVDDTIKKAYASEISEREGGEPYHFKSTIFEPDEDKKQELQDEYIPEEIKEEIFKILLQRYLEPNLTKTDITRCLPQGKKRQGSDFIAQIGFYKMVNAFRLQHFNLLSETDREYTIEERAIASGFKDRFAYANAKKKMSDFDWTTVAAHLPKKL